MDNIKAFNDFVKDFRIERLSPEERKASEMWEKIPEVSKDEYKDAEPLDDELCPYCKEDVGFQEDIFPTGDIIGKKVLDRYTTRFFRKCPKCGKVFYEDLGEEPDRDW